MKKIRVAIFASGTGSNAMALVKAAKAFNNIDISFVLSDRASAPVLGKAQNEGIKSYLIEKKQDKASQENEILFLVKEHRIDWIFLAGYMRLISSNFLSQFASWHSDQSQIVNIHPSLLPLYPGIDSVERAFKDSVPQTGVTLHFVDEGMDTGKIIAQKALAIFAKEDVEALKLRVHQLEHEIYTKFLEDISRGHISTSFFEEK